MIDSADAERLEEVNVELTRLLTEEDKLAGKSSGANRSGLADAYKRACETNHLSIQRTRPRLSGHNPPAPFRSYVSWLPMTAVNVSRLLRDVSSLAPR